MITEQRIESGPVAVNLATGPDTGPPILFLHGVMRRWQDFLTLMPELTLRWRVHGLDFRGHGRSDRAPGRYRVIDYVDDAAACLTGSLREPAVVYGHSLGALVALAVAARLPERVRALVLEDPPAPSLLRNIDRTPFHALFTQMQRFAGSQATVPELAAQLAEIRLPSPTGPIRLGNIRDATSLRFSGRCLQDVDPEVLDLLIAGRWLEGYDGDALWPRVRCPVLLLRGHEARGGMLERADAEAMTRLLADCTLIDIETAGHLIHWLEPAATLRLVVGFLESL